MSLADDTEVVHNTGDETIEGTKTFTGISKTEAPIDITVQYDVNEHPEETQYCRVINVKDKDGNQVGNINAGCTTSGQYTMCMESHRIVDGTDKWATIRTFLNEDGTAYAQAPTPSSTTDNSTKIATTAHLMNVLKAIYPVGSVYIGTQSTCPMSSFFGTWTLVSSGKALWTGDGSNGNTTIAAGLPNITGNTAFAWDTNSSFGMSGAFYKTSNSSSAIYPSGQASKNYRQCFDASKSNSIYGKSSTVQPPAYVVNVWRRTA